MTDENHTELQDNNKEESDEETLKIDMNISDPKETSPVATEPDVDVLKTIEGEIGKQLVEKAEKTNLTVHNVKTIIRQVLTNEHVLALLHKEEDKANFPEPKLTRAKAKELLSSNPVQVPTAWVPQPPPSETSVLVTEELPEDSSEDEEYVPGEDEEENDDSMASESDTSSLPPPTPPSANSLDDSFTQTNWTEDGVFKIPVTRSTPKKENSETANIALRTRSKINLSSTPLETIEKLFIPPDITTDMYDMECDDEEWKEFLKGFTEPLEVAAKPSEDEDHDPEYNILAEYDKIEKVDKIHRKEEFRHDKAVTITKKELKELWEELFEYIENLSGNFDCNVEQDSQITEIEESTFLNASVVSLDAINEDKPDISKNNEESTLLKEEQTNISIQCESTPSKTISTPMLPVESTLLPANDVVLSHDQILIIEQQTRQHIQMLTQNFLLMFEHPEFHDNCSEIKEYLLHFKYLGRKKLFTKFRPVNLEPALKLIDSWIDLFQSNGEEARECKLHVQTELAKSIQYSMAGNFSYIPKFPRLVLKTIAESEVFLYSSLLPKIPFKSELIGTKKGFTDSEDRLLAFGLDHFSDFLLNQENSFRYKNKYGEIQLTVLVPYIHQYMMPHRSKATILRHIRLSKDPRCANNPIKTYFLSKKLTKMVHYIYPLQVLGPPCKRSPDDLPLQIKQFLFPNRGTPSVETTVLVKNWQEGPAPCLYFLSTTTPVSVPTRFVTIQPKVLHSGVQESVKSVKSNRTIREAPKRKLFQDSLRQYDEGLKKYQTSIESLYTIIRRHIPLIKLICFCQDIHKNLGHKENICYNRPDKFNSAMLPSMPVMLNTPVKQSQEQSLQDESISSTLSTSHNDDPQENAKQEIIVEKKRSQDCSYISSNNFQHANVSTEVEFCKTTSNFQISQVTSRHDPDDSVASTSYLVDAGIQEKDNSENNTTLVDSASGKPSNKKEKGAQPSGAEKKKAKIKREFLANLSIATPESPESIKHKEETFAFAFYDKIRATLELGDYLKVIQVLNDFDTGDAVDLYERIEPILKLKYNSLLEEFLLFLREKEAAELGLLIPWIKVNNRAKFLRKIEIYFKDQPGQLKKVYNTLNELSKMENLSMDKIKGLIIPLLKGNTILIDLFLQNFMCERPPLSLLEEGYETIDLNKQLARPESEEMYETIVVPNMEDKYGGQNCICHCHFIEDSFYKSRYKHCTSCGLRFVNGQIFVQSGRTMQPATVSFKTSPKSSHSSRLCGKSMTAAHLYKGQKRKSDTSPNKQSAAAGKDTVDEDTEDEDKGRKKLKNVSKPRKRKKTGESSLDKKSPLYGPNCQKEVKPRKRSNSFKQNKKQTIKSEEIKSKGKEDIVSVKLLDKKKKTQSTDKRIQKKSVNEEQEVLQIVDSDEPKIIFGVDVSDTNPNLNDICTPYINDEGQSDLNKEDGLKKQLESSLEKSNFNIELSKEYTNELNGSGESLEKPSTPEQLVLESGSESQDVAYESDSSSSSTASNIQQSDSNTNDEPPWKREEDTVILETFQQEDDKDYALQIICDKLPNRTISQIRSRFSILMAILIQTLKDGNPPR